MAALDGFEDFEQYKSHVDAFLWEEAESEADAWDEADSLPREELWPTFREMGLLSCLIPEEYGGLDLSHSQYVRLEKEWAKVSGAIRIVLHTHNVNAEIVNSLGRPEQREKYLPRLAEGEISVALALTEPHAGTGTDIETEAVRDGSQYRISGEKHFITNAGFADYMIVVARTGDDFSTFLVPRDAPGLTIRDMPEMMGCAGTSHCYLEFDETPVAADALLGEKGNGVRAIVDHLRVSRIYVAANALGITERSFESAVDWAKQRVTFDKPIAERQAVQTDLADMAADLYALRTAIYDAARKVDERGEAGIEADLCKLLGMEIGKRVTDTAMVLHGGLGYCREFPIERLYRDARLNWLEEGTPSIQRITAAGNILDGDLPYEPTEWARSVYNLDDYDPESGDDYTLSYETE